MVFDSNYQHKDSHDKHIGYDSGDRIVSNESGGLHIFEIHVGTLGHAAGAILLMVLLALLVYCCVRKHAARTERRRHRHHVMRAQLRRLRGQLQGHGQGGPVVVSAPPTAPPSQAGAKEDDFYVDLYRGDDPLEYGAEDESAASASESDDSSKAGQKKKRGRITPSAFCLGPGAAVVCCVEHICC